MIKNMTKMSWIKLVLIISCIVIAGGILQSEAKMEAPQMSEKIKIFNALIGEYVEVQTIVKTDEEWKKILDEEQFYILRKHGTERPFTYEGLHSKEKGIYLCAACGTHLFETKTKFDSGTGWPSFWEPIAKENVGEQVDNTLFMKRTEVHCNRCGGHLGHVFNDGPAPTGERFCINGAALKFLKKESDNE